MRIGFHASHEQIAPSRLLADVQYAERAGFEMAMCSDHFSPWGIRQGHSGYAWGWLGAALATTGLELGCVCAPGQRYHPAVVAQKIATLAEMFPGRFWTALGSGEASNEHITGDRWPPKDVRTRRLEECVDVIRSPAVGPAERPAATRRPRGVGGVGRAGRGLGRRAGDHQPTGGRAA